MTPTSTRFSLQGGEALAFYIKNPSKEASFYPRMLPYKATELLYNLYILSVSPSKRPKKGAFRVKTSPFVFDEFLGAASKSARVPMSWL